MPVIVSKRAGGGVTITTPASANNMQLVRVPRRSQPQQRNQVVVRAVQPPSGGQVSSSRKRRRNRRSTVGSLAVQRPSTFGGAFMSSQARYSGANGTLVMQHCETGDTILGTSAFSGVAIPMVPNSFPYLKGLAQNFSRYRWRSLSASFITASPTSQGGMVGMGAKYDRLEDSPQNLSELSSMSHGWVGPVWGAPGTRVTTLVFDCARWSKPWYSYFEGPSLPGQDEISYVPAYLVFGKETQVNGQVIGRIEFSYSIEFSDPIPSRLQLSTSAAKAALQPTEFGSQDKEPEKDPTEVLLQAVQLLLARQTLEEEPVRSLEGVQGSGVP